MPKPDPAHKETDKILRDMEKRLDEVYKQAYKEARQTADDFMKSFREMDKKKRQQVKNGELDKAEYERWRRTQVFQGNRYHQMADTLAADMTHTNQIAASVINGYLPEVYAVNHNYGTYEIEKGSRINTQYTMYDRQTVERLIRDNPNLLPRKAAVNVPKDRLWNKKHINSAITQGILQGETIDKIAQRLVATVTDMSHTSAIRNARTMTTSAQNGGRIDSYKRAEGMGIKMLQVWMATLDGRTRHEHRQLDGQKRKVGEAFEVEGEKIFFPGDPAAEPYLTYNCRCTLVGEVEGVDYNLSDKSQRDNKLGDMTYEEWKEEKRKQDNAEPPAPKREPKPEPKTEDKPAEVEVPAPTVEKPDAVDEPVKPKLTIFDEMEQNRKEIDKTLHDVEEMRRSLDYEVGTIIDRKGNIVEVINGSEHSVAVDDGALKDLIFTHNHPSGGCFSDNDIINMIDDELLELRASTPQGTYHSLLRTSKASKESSTELVKGFKKANSIVTATKQVQEDLKKGIITKQEAKDKGFNLYIEYMSKSSERFLTENAEKYGYIYTKGVI
ncbi:MAG TPA: phage minor head protein [Ruminococcus sp.]|nr:phage minor head protein [Ruminococcus sp.]